MSAAEDTFNKGVEYRQLGNEAFKKQDFKEALKNYYTALLHLKTIGGQSQKEVYKTRSDEQLVMIYNNMTAVFSKQERWDRVLFYAQKAHEIDPKNTKTKFRMGQAYLRLENVEKAKILLDEVLAENPEGKG